MWGKTPSLIEHNLISISPKCLGSVVAYQPPPRLGVLVGIKEKLKINSSIFWKAIYNQIEQAGKLKIKI